MKSESVTVQVTMQDCKTLFTCKFTFEQSPWRSQPRSFRVWTLASRPMSRTQRPRGMLTPPFFLLWISSLPLVLLFLLEESLECFSWSTRSNLTLKLFNPNHSLTPSPRTQLDHLKCLCKVCKVRKGGIGGGVGASKTETRREEGKDSRSDLCSAILCSHLRPRKTSWLPA